MSAILQFFPDRTDVNGDAQNALVLAQRASWAGFVVELVPVAAGDIIPRERPAAIVIGSSVDAEILGLRNDLLHFATALQDWVSEGVPLLAVGTGFELLSHGIPLGDGHDVEGLGILPGRAQPLPARATADLIVDAREGRLVGFENHARGMLLPADASALGTVVKGSGNDGRSEGSRRGSAIGTHLHGPVLAKNPVLADAMLRDAFGDSYRADSPEAAHVDALATAARAAILNRLDLPADSAHS